MRLVAKLVWVALPALAGCAVLSQVSSQGTGTESGGKATPFSTKAAGAGLANTLNLQNLSKEEQLFVLVDAAAKEITGRPNPGLIKLQAPYDRPTLFGMDSELDYNRARLYAFTKAAEIDIRVGESAERFAARISGHTDRSIAEVEGKFNFKVTEYAKWNIQGGVNAIVVSKFPYKENSYSMLGQEHIAGVNTGELLIRTSLKRQDHYFMACAEYASAAVGLNKLQGIWFDTSEDISLKEFYRKAPKAYLDVFAQGGDVRRLGAGEVLGPHGWSQQIFVFNPPKNPEGFPDWVDEYGTMTMHRDPTFLNEHFGIGSETPKDPIKILDTVLERLVYIDPNTPELRNMFEAVRFNFRGSVGNIKSDYRAAKPLFDFYGKLVDGKRAYFEEVDGS